MSQYVTNEIYSDAGFETEPGGKIINLSGVGYLAHPYTAKNHEMEAKNAKENREMQDILSRWYKDLYLINPIDNGQHFEEHRKNWEMMDLLRKEFLLLERCDFLILPYGWEQSRGCLAEWSLALARKKPILKIVLDGPESCETAIAYEMFDLYLLDAGNAVKLDE